MLILQRRSGESIRIGDNIEVTVVAIEGGRVRLAISAPSDVSILRSELIVAQETNIDAAMGCVAPDQVLHMLDSLLQNAPQTQSPAPVKLMTQKEIQKNN